MEKLLMSLFKTFLLDVQIQTNMQELMCLSFTVCIKSQTKTF